MAEQFEFRSGCGTRDAVFICKRLIEQCHNSKDSSLIFLALDWAKAFDSIDPACLFQSLRRFGLPEKYLHVISNIYTNREFVVVDHRQKSQSHQQVFGISQGCPLSPFLFVMLMTVLLHDANVLLQQEFPNNETSIECNELVYADDTLLIGRDTAYLQAYMNFIAQVGKTYGLSLNWKKVEQMNIKCQDMHIYSLDGDVIQIKECSK